MVISAPLLCVCVSEAPLSSFLPHSWVRPPTTHSSGCSPSSPRESHCTHLPHMPHSIFSICHTSFFF